MKRRLRLDQASQLIYRVFPLHDFSKPGAPVSAYGVERLGNGMDERGLSVGSHITIGRFESKSEARAVLAHVPAGFVDDECAA